MSSHVQKSPRSQHDVTSLQDPDRLIYDWTDHIKEPKWVNEKAYDKCALAVQCLVSSCVCRGNRCHHCAGPLKSGHRHHCRLCGEMYCSACTGKYHLPVNFHGPKKHKLGALAQLCGRMFYSERDDCAQVLCVSATTAATTA